jgi:nitroreductase
MEKELYTHLKTVADRRKSTRLFSEKAISAELVEKIKEIALTSPYASGKKNWDIKIIQDLDVIYSLVKIIRKKSEEITSDIREDYRDMFVNYAKNFSAFESAPVLFVPFFRVTRALSRMHKNPGLLLEWERDNFVKSISCVAMLIILAAESLGLGSCYMTGPLIAEAGIKEILQIHKNSELGAVIPVGYSHGEK